MSKTIELRVFTFLTTLFRERNWPIPMTVPLTTPVTGCELLTLLEIDSTKVEAMFINGKAGPLTATIHPGDRVALLPPGTPGPYRVLLGIRGKK